VGSNIRPAHIQRLHPRPSVIPQSQSGRSDGHETQWPFRQHNYKSRAVVLTDVPHVHPFTDWHTDSWSGLEDVHSVQVSECGVTSNTCQQNKVCRQGWFPQAGPDPAIQTSLDDGCRQRNYYAGPWVPRVMDDGAGGCMAGCMRPPCMGHQMCSGPGRWYRRGKAGCLPLPAWTIR
jgi:hypothetical protein